MNKKRMSVRETLKLNNRALSIFYRRYPQMVLSRFISVIWTALTPYVGIFLSALVIDELAGERNPQRLRVLVLTTLFFTALAALASALLNKWKETQNAGLWLKVNHIFSEKLLNMDYVSLDETRTAELLSTIRQNQAIDPGPGCPLDKLFRPGNCFFHTGSRAAGAAAACVIGKYHIGIGHEDQRNLRPFPNSLHHLKNSVRCGSAFQSAQDRKSVV